MRGLVACCVACWLFGDTFAKYSPAPRDGHVLRFAHFGSYHDYEFWREVIAEFEAAQGEGDVRIRQEYIVGLANRYTTKMRQQILSHTLPDVALIQLGPFHDLATHFADLGELLQPSANGDTSLASKLDPTGLAAFEVHQRAAQCASLRGLPVSGGNLLIYVNPACFERASRHLGRPVPLPSEHWTMEEFRRTADLLTCDFDGDGSIDQFGFWLPRWIYYLPFLWSHGARLTDDGATSWQLVGPEAEQAIDFYHDLAVSNRVCPRDDEVPQLFQDTGFLTGRVAMCVSGPWFQPFLARTRLADGYRVAHIPIGPAGRITRITWDGIVMARGLPPKKRAIAGEFIRFVLSKPVQDRLARIGRALPARIESQAAFVDVQSAARRRRFVEALGYARLQPLLPRFGEVDRAINRHLTRLTAPATDSTAKQMLESLAKDPAVRGAFPHVGVGGS